MNLCKTARKIKVFFLGEGPAVTLLSEKDILKASSVLFESLSIFNLLHAKRAPCQDRNPSLTLGRMEKGKIFCYCVISV